MSGRNDVARSISPRGDHLLPVLHGARLCKCFLSPNALALKSTSGVLGFFSSHGLCPPAIASLPVSLPKFFPCAFNRFSLLILNRSHLCRSSNLAPSLSS